jgi:hypothetical protein
MKILASQMKGYWARGSADECPDGYFPTFSDLMVRRGQLMVRPGMPSSIAFTGVLALSVYQAAPVSGVSTPKLIGQRATGGIRVMRNLTDAFSFYVVLAAAPYDYHAWLNMFGRGYFSIHNTIIGSAAESLQVYEGGVTNARNAAGLKPVSAMLAVASGTPGHLGVGIYLFDVCYITTSGFITKPSGNVKQVSVFGTASVDLSVIPIGPAGTAGRIIVMTKGINLSLYTGNPNDYEFFFYTTRINNNVATTLNVSEFDGNLVTSADYLFDQLELIPSGVGLLNYNGRLLSWGEAANPSVIRVSKPADPESIDATSGIITVDPSEGGGVKNCFILRNSLFICKANKTYVTTDTGDDASTWRIDEFDSGVGTEPYGAAQVLDSKGSNLNQIVIASRSGIVIFDGIVRTPELTYYIEDFWRAIKDNQFPKTKLVLDPIHKHLYCFLKNVNDLGILLMGDYSEGLDAEHIKWSVWSYTSDEITSLAIMMNANNLPDIYVSIFGAITSFNVDTPSSIDVIGPITGKLQTPALLFGNPIGTMQQINEIEVRQIGLANGDVCTVQALSLSKPAIVGPIYTIPFVTDATVYQTKRVYTPFVDYMPAIKLSFISTNLPKFTYMDVRGGLYGDMAPM